MYIHNALCSNIITEGVIFPLPKMYIYLITSLCGQRVYTTAIDTREPLVSMLQLLDMF